MYKIQSFHTCGLEAYNSFEDARERARALANTQKTDVEILDMSTESINMIDGSKLKGQVLSIEHPKKL